MNLEDQVCSLELSRRLKELGVKQESQFYWVHRPDHEMEGDSRFIREDWANGKGLQMIQAEAENPEWSPWKTLSAFTVAELLEMSPAKTYLRKDRPHEWEANVAVGGELSATGETAADAVAALVIRRLEEALAAYRKPQAGGKKG